jgi:hypothetical protein
LAERGCGGDLRGSDFEASDLGASASAALGVLDLRVSGWPIFGGRYLDIGAFGCLTTISGEVPELFSFDQKAVPET